MNRIPKARSRRDALKLLAGTAIMAPMDPVTMLINSLVNGFIQKASAESSGTAPRNHVFIGLFGAPPRWYFDLPLDPYTGLRTDPENAGVVTRFQAPTSGSKVSTAEFSNPKVTSANGKSLYMPHLWSTSIPTVNDSGVITGSVAMSQLMDNLAVIRGIRMTGDGHEFLHLKALRPDSSGPSIHGLVADASSRYVPAVLLQGSAGDFSTGYSAPRGTALTKSSYQNPLDNILGVFNRKSSNKFNSGSLLSRREAMESAVKQALDSMADIAKSNHPGSDAIYVARSNAEAFLKAGIGDVSSAYTTLYNKYSALLSYITNWASHPITGITDKEILTTDSGLNWLYNRVCGSTVLSSSTSNFDLRKILQSTEAKSTLTSSANNALAMSFAVTEYLIRYGYSSTINFSLSGIHYLRLPQGNTYNLMSKSTDARTATTSLSYTSADGGINYAGATQSFDEHATGGHGGRNGSLLTNSIFYSGLAACINELKRALGTDLFKETVVQLSSEFSRLPNGIGSGSEHATYTSVTSLFSGAIQNPVVVGNTTRESRYSATASTDADNPNANYNGYYGVGGLTRVDGNEIYLGPGHVASTLAHLLRVDSPTPNNPSLLSEGAGGVVSGLEDTAKEVDE